MSFDEFNTHFQAAYGERWPILLAALRRPERQVARKNIFTQMGGTDSFNPAINQDSLHFEEWTGGELSRDASGLLTIYVMDPASILAATALQVCSGDQVLDMCAAPGGKTLILTEALATDGQITANELSADRRDRLKKVIQQYIPRDVRNRVWVTGKEGGLYAKTHPGKFDKVLVDAPCSGERHILQSPKDLKEWSLNRTKKLAQRQYALLTGALEAVRSGGRIVYSTCSISSLENDEVIERLLEKKGDRVTVVDYVIGPIEVVGSAEANDVLGSADAGEFPITAERTKYGQQFFPDRCGFGPIYFSVLEKK